MASLRSRALAAGGESHTVTWRDPSEGMRSRTFRDRDKAQELKDFLDANGNSFKLAAKAKILKDSTSPTVAEVVDRHISLLRKPQPGTIAKYRRMAAGHIHGSDFGNTPVDRVTREAVTAWLDGLVALSRANQPSGEHLSRKSKQNVHALVSAAFKRAAEDGVMAGNPARGIAEADRADAREPVYLSRDDLDLLADEAPAEYRLFIRTLAKTGLRYSEATALRKRDVTVRAGRCSIHVTRAWKATDAGEAIGPPKTKKAKRTVACPLPLSAELIEHMAPLGLDDLLFTRPDGDYLRNSWFHKFVWQPMVTRLVQDGRLDRAPWIHEIRHAVTTHLLESGRPVHEVQAHMGHEDPQTTLRVYARLAPEAGTAAADALA